MKFGSLMFIFQVNFINFHIFVSSHVMWLSWCDSCFNMYHQHRSTSNEGHQLTSNDPTSTYPKRCCIGIVDLYFLFLGGGCYVYHLYIHNFPYIYIYLFIYIWCWHFTVFQNRFSIPDCGALLLFGLAALRFKETRESHGQVDEVFEFTQIHKCFLILWTESENTTEKISMDIISLKTLCLKANASFFRYFLWSSCSSSRNHPRCLPSKALVGPLFDGTAVCSQCGVEPSGTRAIPIWWKKRHLGLFNGLFWFW